jgi:hypothetical protein
MNALLSRAAAGLLFLLCVSGHAADVCVDFRNLSGNEDGSPERPFNTIQEAVNAAANGDTVKVALGLYTEDVRIENKSIALRGGYAGADSSVYAEEGAGDFAAQDRVDNVTVINGTGEEATVTLLDAAESLVNGFVIRGGGGSSIELPYSSRGGGFYIVNGAPVISDNEIIENDARREETDYSFGGGIHAENAGVTISGNTIAENAAGRGAAISINGGANVRILDNVIHHNDGYDDHGGGLYIAAPEVEIRRNQVYSNQTGVDTGYGWGGGIIVLNPGNSAQLSHNVYYDNFAPTFGAAVFIDEGASAVMQNELVYRNRSDPGSPGGGAVYVDGGPVGPGGEMVGSVLTMLNCTVVNNPIEDWYVGGNGLLIDGQSTATVRNCIFWGNEADFAVFDGFLTVTYTNALDIVDGDGNTSVDPLFADPDGDDYHLRATAGRWDPQANGGAGAFVNDDLSSPCIDAGNPTDPFNAEPAPNGGRVNLGAYGNTTEASKSQSGGEGEGEGDSGLFTHSADQDSDGVVRLSELLRVVQLFNMGAYHCEAGTEDGYNSGPGDDTCAPHASDYNPANWRIELTELLRLVQLYNYGAYIACPGQSDGEDGYCLAL